MQNSTDIKTKIDTKLATEAATAASTTATVANPPLSKKDLKVPENWELIFGDLDKLESEDSNEWIVYQNKAYKAPAAENAAAADQKNDKEKEETALLSHIFLYRKEEKIYHSASERFEKTEESPVILYLLYKDTKEAKKFSKLGAVKPLQLYCIRGKEFPDSEVLRLWRTIKTTEHLENLMFSSENSGINCYVSVMREHIAEQLFDTLVEKEILSRVVVDYFKLILGHKPVPKTEQQKRALIQKALNENARDKVLRIAREIHMDAIEENRKHKRLLDTVEDGGVETHYYLDDATVAYEVGEGWSTAFPEDAYKAYGILTESSPLHDEAKAKMTIMAHELCMRAASTEGVNSVKARSYREKALMSALEATGNDDPKKSQESTTLFFKLLEVQAGYNAMGNENRLFKSFDNKPFSKNILFEAFCVMANALYEKNNAISAPIATHLKMETDSKTSKEAALVKVGAATAAAIVTTSTAAHEITGRPILKPLTFTFSNSSTGSLDEDEPIGSLVAQNAQSIQAANKK